MKLTNPTDDELNRAFAEKVAGWTYRGMGIWTDPAGVECFGTKKQLFQPFTRSMDAVLPWLEKSPFDVQITFSNTCDMWTVRLQGRFTSEMEFVHSGDSCEPFPRACVIALLRAHGVGVEFTK